MPTREPSGRTVRSRLQPPMGPMIDCVFQLLIFFLLMPGLRMDEGYLTTNLPSSAGPNAVGPEWFGFVNIRLQHAGPGGTGVLIFLNGNQALGSNFEGLRGALEDLRARGLAADYPVRIAPSHATRHKWVVRAFDAVVAARFTNVCFAVPEG